ncbi:MAG: YecA family protein [Burkholderia sp.]|jgi:uncharacterized protein
MTISDPYEKPLSGDELVELGELLAGIPEPFEPMESDYLDGYLTGLLCLPEEPAPGEWMPYVLDAQNRDGIPEGPDTERLRELVWRRYRSIDRDLEQCRPIDPIILVDGEDDEGGTQGAAPFALGFSEAITRFPGVKDSEDKLVASALLGILRYLPEEAAGDMAEVKEELDEKEPVEDLDEALADIAESVAEIASVTRGFKKKAGGLPRRHGARR